MNEGIEPSEISQDDRVSAPVRGARCSLLYTGCPTIIIFIILYLLPYNKNNAS